MIFKKEVDLENHIRKLIKDRIIPYRDDLVLLNSKKVADLVICRGGNNSSIFFLEIKLYKSADGRLPIGQGKGKGFQPEIISKKPDYLENHLRWILCDKRKETNNYILVPTSTIAKYPAGGSISEKFNNIQIKIFDEIPAVNDDGLIKQLNEFFSS